MKTTVIICLNKDDAIWAVKYFNSHKNEKIYILSADIGSQLTLVTNHIPNDTLLNLEKKLNNELYKKNINLWQEGLKIYNMIKINFKPLKINFKSVNLFDLIKDNIILVYADIYYSFYLHKKILSKLNPQKIYIPKNNNTYININNLSLFTKYAYFLKNYFLKDTIIDTYNSKRNTINIFLNTPVILVRLPLFIKFLLIKLFIRPNQIIKVRKKKIIMQTGGIITSYFFKLFNLLGNKFNLYIQLYEIPLLQQVLLTKKRISFSNINNLLKSKKLSQKIHDQILLIYKKINLVSEFTKLYKQKNINPFIMKIASLETKYYFKINLLTIIRRLLLNIELVEKIKPDLIINTHDPGLSGSTLVLPAKRKKIPSVLLLHGIPYGSNFIEYYSDYLITWGEVTKNFVIDKLKRPNKIFTSGFPAFDNYQQQIIKINRNFRPNFTIKKRLKIGLLLTSYWPDDTFQTFQTNFLFDIFFLFSKLNHKIEVNFRQHEGYDQERDQIIALGKYFHVTTFNNPLLTLDNFIKNNDIVLSWDTTAILWSMLYQKPLFHTTPFWGKGQIPTSQYQAAWNLNNVTDFKRKLNKLISKPDIYYELLPGQKKFLEDYAGPLDGKSSERLVRLIEKLTKDKKLL